MNHRERNVHILASCLTPERLPFTTLVFRTIRIGFPTANILVYGNALDPQSTQAVGQATEDVGGLFRYISIVSHGEWIERLIQTERDPFWICDTDVVFFDKVEDWTCELFSGRYEPEFFESWTQSHHVARLHPSLMLFNPGPLRTAMRAWPGCHEFFNSVNKDLIQWHWECHRSPEGVSLRFYDTCAGLYHALGGTPFTDHQNAAYAHLHCGTYGHLIVEHNDLHAAHAAVLKNPEVARWLTMEQTRWYKEHPCGPR